MNKKDLKEITGKAADLVETGKMPADDAPKQNFEHLWKLIDAKIDAIHDDLQILKRRLL